MKNKQAEVNKLRLKVRNELAKISKSAYPAIYEQIQTQDDYEGIERSIIRYATKNHVSIGTAIAQLEMEYSSY